ncbi:MAG: cytochrome c biogenesis protein [Cyanobacteria bacterium P01_H01_bin.15]
MSSTANLNPFNPQYLGRRALRFLADLRLAIILLLLIALFSISGTVIEQGQSQAYYQANYPTNPALFGFLSWQVIEFLGLDHVYSTPWFLALLVVFGASLTTCTFRRQLPALKAARRWQYYKRPQRFEKLALSAEFERASFANLPELIRQKNYKIFQQDNALYARKGIAGRIGPIVVHLGIIVILGGAIWGTAAGFLAQELIPSGNTFQIRNFLEIGRLAQPQRTSGWEILVNRFWIDYTPEGDLDQFYSDLSLRDRETGAELKRKTISVNHPMRYSGVTFYQTDWGIANIRVQFGENSPVFELPVAPLQDPGGQLWGTWVPTKPDLSEGIALITRDMQGTLFAYDQSGQLIGGIRAGGNGLEINGVRLKVNELIGSTGMEIKGDPGVPFVYGGFALLMLGVVMSYVSHSQVWALQSSGRLWVGGRTNRAQVTFERELIEIFDQLSQDVPESPEPTAEAPDKLAAE